MPAQKRTHDFARATEENYDDQLPENENQENPKSLDGSDSCTEKYKDDDEFLAIDLADIRKDVQCPICLGVIRKTRTVMECLHRFCRECIDKAMRLGNKECPACRTHCASRRSLRDDPNYDALIAALYPDIDKYEEEEMALHEEERKRNKELQDSIAHTLRRQIEALGMKRSRGKAKGTASIRRSQCKLCSVRTRRQSYLNDDHRRSDDNEDEGGNNTSSADEHSAELGPKRSKTRTGIQFSHPPKASASEDGGWNESVSEVDREHISKIPALLRGSETLTWGRSGLRSRGSNGKDTCKISSSSFIDHLRNSENDESGVGLKLIPLDSHELPKLQQLYVSCRPTLSVRQLCEYIAFQNALETNDIEIYSIQEKKLEISTVERSPSNSDNVHMDPRKHKIQVIKEQETLAGIQSISAFGPDPLVLAYGKKFPNSSH